MASFAAEPHSVVVARAALVGERAAGAHSAVAALAAEVRPAAAGRFVLLRPWLRPQESIGLDFGLSNSSFAILTHPSDWRSELLHAPLSSLDHFENIDRRPRRLNALGRFLG